MNMCDAPDATIVPPLVAGLVLNARTWATTTPAAARDDIRALRLRKGNNVAAVQDRDEPVSEGNRLKSTFTQLR
jgi:hypothetical protein